MALLEVHQTNKVELDINLVVEVHIIEVEMEVLGEVELVLVMVKLEVLADNMEEEEVAVEI